MIGLKTSTNINNNCIESEDIHKLLGITLDLKLETHINKLEIKASQKLNAIEKLSLHHNLVKMLYM